MLHGLDQVLVIDPLLRRNACVTERTGALEHIRPDRVFEVHSAAEFMAQVETLWQTLPRPDTFRGQASLGTMKPSLTREGGTQCELRAWSCAFQ